MSVHCNVPDIQKISQYLAKNCKPDGSNYQTVCAQANQMYGTDCSCDSDQLKCPSAPDPSPPSPSPSKDGHAGFQQCKSKPGSVVCDVNYVDNCCRSYCGTDSACYYDCTDDAQNYCSGQGTESCTSDNMCTGGMVCVGGKCQNSDRGKKLGDSCCRYDATNGQCEQIGTCYEKECASPDKCFIKDDTSCTSCNNSGCGSCYNNQNNKGKCTNIPSSWIKDFYNAFVNALLTIPNITKPIAQCIANTLAKKYPDPTKIKDKIIKGIVADCIAGSIKDPGSPNFNDVKPPQKKSDKTLIVLAIGGVLLVGIMLYFIFKKVKM
jgi:hypothetical protein